MMNRGLVRCFESLVSHTVESSRRRLLIAKTRSSLTQLSKNKAYRTWVANAATRSRQQRLVASAAARVTGRSERGCLMRCFNCWRYHWEGQGWLRGVLDGVASAELKVQGWCLDHMVGFAERMGWPFARPSV